MTEAEIIKALECCSVLVNCKGCYFDTHESDDICGSELIKKALDLINRKNAEIELLENESKRQATKAIKEFAERVKKSSLIAGFLGDVVCVGYIDQIAKEMGAEL